jgi:hypothetical protein
MHRSLIQVRSKLMLALAVAAVPFVVGCASNGRDALPENARVETLQTASLVMRGEASTTPGGATCDATAPAKHFLELTEETNGAIMLRPPATHEVTVLHVTELATNKSWCVMTKGDGAQVSIPGDFAAGVYAISIVESHSYKPDPYEVVFEKM